MDAWKKNVVPNYSRRAVRTKLNYSSNKENSCASNRNGKSNVNSLGGGKLPNQEFPSQKSLTCRLLFPKHDDSVHLMTFEEAEETTKIPIRHESDFTSVSSVHGKVTDRVGYPLHESKSELSECIKEPDLTLSKETIDYLRKNCIVASAQSSAKLCSISTFSNVKVSEPASTMKMPLISVTKEKSISEKNEGKNITVLDSIEQLLSRHAKEREEIVLQWQKESEELRKKHEEELKAIFYPSEIAEIPQVADSGNTLMVSQGIEDLSQVTMPEEFIVNTPCSGSWICSEERIAGLSSSTPTLRPNDTLDNMTFERSPGLETPATRRLVAKRIMKGIESLFKE